MEGVEERVRVGGGMHAHLSFSNSIETLEWIEATTTATMPKNLEPISLRPFYGCRISRALLRTYVRTKSPLSSGPKRGGVGEGGHGHVNGSRLIQLGLSRSFLITYFADHHQFPRSIIKPGSGRVATLNPEWIGPRQSFDKLGDNDHKTPKARSCSSTIRGSLILKQPWQ